MAKVVSITGKPLSGEWGVDDEAGRGTPVLRTTNFTNEGILNYTNVVTRKITKKNIVDKFLQKGDIIIEKSGGSDKQPVGRVVYFDGPENIYLINNFTGLLRVKDRNSWLPKYVFYALFCNYQRGGTRRFENKTTGLHNLQTESYINSFEIKEIDMNKQRQIVKVLDTTKTIVESRKKQLDLLDNLIKSRFVEMFGDENNSKSWKYVEIGDVTEVQVGVVIKPAQYYTDEINGNKAFRSLNVGELKVKDNDWVYFNEEGNKVNSRSILKENDILVVRSGAPGTSCVVTKEFEGSNAIDVIIARVNENLVNPYYLAAYTNFPHGKNQIIAGTGGAAQQHFNVGRYRTMKLMLPPMELQNEYNRFLKQTDKLKVEVQKSIDETQMLFDSLMQLYFG